jgi:hypothetical protein
MQVTITIETDGTVAVDISDDTGYSPDLAHDMCARARETATAAHRELHAAT